ncbi:MAG: hypothetical protein MUO26_02955 [Methanotrichaceae archaeon]|nr:hypothetical protein [Methanotrichaceae archaeon]
MIRDDGVKDDLPGVDMVSLIGTALQSAKELVKEGNLSLGETAEIGLDLDLPPDPLIEAVLGQTDSVQVLYIDQNYKLITHTLVDKPSVVILIDQNGIAYLWEQLDGDYKKVTGENAGDGTAIAMIDEILSKKYGPACDGGLFLLSHLMIATFTMAV